MHTYRSIYNQESEKKRDYHIMLSPSTQQKAAQQAKSVKQSLSTYIEQALLYYMTHTH
ncbi:hypothetical protein JK159_02225 [Weissella minor]|uniref:hypothetical protein n=1 Tax=Weissella minor TaxID=1620 RepID=UPI001BB00F7F|nr:hypothetical protein [Weissella minor]MBS0949199.1 hypothetical protein [Weissella minor]